MQAFRVQLLLSCVVYFALPTHAGGAEGILGLVEVPSIYGPYNPDDPWGLEDPEAAARLLTENPRRPVGLRERASGDSRVAHTVTSSDQLEGREFAYEAPGAVVYARVNGWSQLRTLGGQMGWLAPEDSGPFHSLEELLRDGLTYLTEAWDGTLSSAPGGGERQTVPAYRPTIVGYLGVVDWRPGMSRVRPEPLRPLFERPDKAARVVGRVGLDRLAGLTSTAPRVIVFDTRPGWYQVALGTEDWHDWRDWQRVWIEPGDHWDRAFHPVTASEGRKLLSEAWGADARPVNVVGFRRVNGASWIRVEILDESVCRGKGPPAVVAQGWIPAHAPMGAPTAWFYSRGC